MGCTDVEIAAWFECSVSTIQTKRKEEPYKTIFVTARESMDVSLRRAQMKLALAGNPSMLIWLGKVRLGQKETLRLGNDAAEPFKMDSTIRIIQVKPKSPAPAQPPSRPDAIKQVMQVKRVEPHKTNGVKSPMNIVPVVAKKVIGKPVLPTVRN